MEQGTRWAPCSLRLFSCQAPKLGLRSVIVRQNTAGPRFRPIARTLPAIVPHSVQDLVPGPMHGSLTRRRRVPPRVIQGPQPVRWSVSLRAVGPAISAPPDVSVSRTTLAAGGFESTRSVGQVRPSRLLERSEPATASLCAHDPGFLNCGCMARNLWVPKWYPRHATS